jgi:hypothetical protein
LATCIYDDPALKFLKTDFDSSINNIFSFYNRHSVKRKASLRNTAEAIDEELYELNYIHSIRWVSSKYSALDRVDKNHIIMLTNLESIKVDPDFDRETQQVASGNYAILLNVRFKAFLLFMMDVLNLIKSTSLKLQERSGVLIGMEKLRSGLLAAIESLRNNDGPHIRAFLEKYKCRKDAGMLRKCKTTDLDDKEFVLNEQFTLAPDASGTRARNPYPKLSETRGIFIDRLKEQLNKYFPEGSLSVFDVLIPSQLPRESGDVYVYAAEITDLAQRFGFDPVPLSNEFAYLLHSLIDDHFNELCLHQDGDDPVQFWSYFLAKPTVAWQPNIKRAVEHALVVPIATADVERGFSILNHIAYDRRSRLGPTRLRNLMFLRINGPSLSQFDSIRYAKAWRKCGGMRTDDPRQARKKPKNELPHSDLF